MGWRAFVSQSNPAGYDHQGDVDPLLAFDEEAPPAESPEKPVNTAPSPAAAEEEDAAPLRQRLEHAERSLDRARIEISSLKSDLATLVSTVEDIKKRLKRRPEVILPPPVVRAPHRPALGRPAAMVILLLTLGVAIWGAASVALIEIPEPPAGETESSLSPPAGPPPPAVAIPAVEPQTANTAPAARPARRPVEREPVRPAAYVGTLSIDSEPSGDVLINRQAAGRTPMRAENLRAGSHLIWIEREGYHRWTRVVAVAANRVTRVWADLDPLSR